MGAAAGALLVPLPAQPAAAATLTGFAPKLAAMHVHGSWSEGTASWETQFSEASRNGIELLYLTEHDFRALAYNYMTSLAGVPMVVTSTGSFKRRAATTNNGALRLLAESSGSAAASLTMAIEEKPTAWNRLRTSIAGHSLEHTFGSVTLSPGALYEVVVQLSHHPAVGGRPAGSYQLRYRFGSSPTGMHLEGSGLVGVVRKAKPGSGSKVVLDLASDVSALWPDLLALDNVLGLVSFVVTSPRKGALADVGVTSFRFVRTESSEAAVVANQRAIIDAYGPRHPGLRARAGVEVSRLDPHCNAFGVPQFMPNQSLITATTRESFYRDMIGSVHRQGGLVSWNHPFGATAGPALSPADQVAKRRTLFASLWANDLFGADILEVGYPIRGQVTIGTHLDLWDTFSRRGRFLTGNGVNDDHSGWSWRTLANGFLTGVWSATSDDATVMSALASGRAYTRHTGQWPDGQLDLLVDDRVPMGMVSVAPTVSRSVTLLAARAPATGVVELVSGPVDYTGSDPGTVVLERIPASSIGSSGLVTRTVDTSTSCFVRTQVRDGAGTIVGVSNPVWLLREQPPAGIPRARTI